MDAARTLVVNGPVVVAVPLKGPCEVTLLTDTTETSVDAVVEKVVVGVETKGTAAPDSASASRMANRMALENAIVSTYALVFKLQLSKICSIWRTKY